VLILTLNEEINIRECLTHSPGATISWSRFHEHGPYARDRRRAWRARRFEGVRQLVRTPELGRSNIEFRYPWVLYLDADERCPTDLRDECSGARGSGNAGCVPDAAQGLLHGAWLKHAQLYRPGSCGCFAPIASVTNGSSTPLRSLMARQARSVRTSSTIRSVMASRIG